MPIGIIRERVSKDELRRLSGTEEDEMIKAVVDVEREVLAVGGELHADEEAVLLEDSSRQENLWGINLYLDRPKEQWIEFRSIINIRPRQGNRSHEIQDPELRAKIQLIIQKLIG